MKRSQDKPQILLDHHLKALRLPVFMRERQKTAAQCAKEQADFAEFLLRLSEAELLERERKGTERRIKTAKFPARKSLDEFDFLAAPGVNKTQILELARCAWIDKRDCLVLLGNPGTGKTHIATALGINACQRGYNTRFFTATGLVNALLEARSEKALLRLQTQLQKAPLLIIDELGYVPFTKTGAELLFEVFSQRYESGSILVTSNLPFDEWTSVLESERLTGALLDRLTHRAHILTFEGESYRVAHSRSRRAGQAKESTPRSRSAEQS